MNAPRQPNKPREPGTIKDAVEALYAQHGGRKWIEAKLNLGHSQVAAYTDMTSKEELPLSKAVMLTSRETPALAEFFALIAHGVFVPVEPAPCELGKLCADTVRDHSSAVASLVEAMQDRVVDRKEAGDALNQLKKSIAAQVSLYARLIAIRQGTDKGETA